MIDFHHIYEYQSDKYDMLIRKEDHENNLLQAIIEIVHPEVRSLDIIDMGAGTGRLSLLLTPFANSINLFDASLNMLRLAERNLKETDSYNWHIRQADNRSIPMPDKSADLIISGWSISSLVIENHDKWEKEIDRAIREMIRLCRTGGTITIIETLGTVSEEPSPPLELVEFYDYLEDKYGFSKKWVRTDFKFNSMEEARELIGFFFGETASESIESNPNNIVPECTGIWWLNL